MMHFDEVPFFFSLLSRIVSARAPFYLWICCKNNENEFWGYLKGRGNEPDFTFMLTLNLALDFRPGFWALGID